VKSFGPDIFKYTNFREYLVDTLKKMKRSDSSFSYRGLAEYLGFSDRGHVYQILSGKRNLTPHVSLQISELLRLNRRKTLYFEYLAMWQQAPSELLQNEYFKRMCWMNPKLKRRRKSLNKKRSFSRRLK
jgi:uncharacterized protein (TIGR02147 family)